MEEWGTAVLSWLPRACPVLGIPTMEERGAASTNWISIACLAHLRPAMDKGCSNFLDLFHREWLALAMPPVEERVQYPQPASIGHDQPKEAQIRKRGAQLM